MCVCGGEFISIHACVYWMRVHVHVRLCFSVCPCTYLCKSCTRVLSPGAWARARDASSNSRPVLWRHSCLLWLRLLAALGAMCHSPALVHHRHARSYTRPATAQRAPTTMAVTPAMKEAVTLTVVCLLVVILPSRSFSSQQLAAIISTCQKGEFSEPWHQNGGCCSLIILF